MLHPPGPDSPPQVATHLTGVTVTVPLDPWLDTRALAEYSNLSRRTLHHYLHALEDPIPHSHVGAKILVRRSAFDAWMERRRCRRSDAFWRLIDETVEAVLTKPATPRRRKPEHESLASGGSSELPPTAR